MKNALKVVIFTVVFLAAAAGAVFGVYKYNKSDFAVADGSEKNTTVITGYTGSASELEIPQKIRGKKVVAIDKGAFEESKIKSVTIPDAVTKIEESAFAKCAELEKVAFGGKVETIGEKAFYECKKLSEVTLPKSLKDIGDVAFFGCESLKKIDVEDGSNFVFDNGVLYSADKSTAYLAVAGTDLSDYKFPAETNAFMPYFFYGHEELESFDIPPGMTSIPGNMFVMCTSLKSVTIPDSVTFIGNSAFLGCPSLDELYVPKSVKKIGTYCFPVMPKTEEKDDKNKSEEDKKKDAESEKYFNNNFKLIVEEKSAAYNYAVANGIKYEIKK